MLSTYQDEDDNMTLWKDMKYASFASRPCDFSIISTMKLFFLGLFVLDCCSCIYHKFCVSCLFTCYKCNRDQKRRRKSMDFYYLLCLGFLLHFTYLAKQETITFLISHVTAICYQFTIKIL